MNQYILEAFEYNQHLVAYLNIVNYWKSHKAEGNVELHHIVPRSFFKNANLPCDNSEDNIVALPYEYHQKIHSLAVLCAKEIIKASMINADNLMNRKKTPGWNCGKNNPNYGKGLKGELNPNYGKSHWFALTDEIRYKLGSSNRGKVLSAETRRKISEANKGKNVWSKNIIKTPEWNKKNSEAQQEAVRAWKEIKSTYQGTYQQFRKEFAARKTNKLVSA